MAHYDAGYGAGNAAMLDMEIAGADTRQRHPDDSIPFVQQDRLRLVQELKFSLINISLRFSRTRLPLGSVHIRASTISAK